MDGDGAAVVTRGAGRTIGGTVVLEDIDLRVERGVILGVVGPSGCGKTTLIRLLLGIAAATAGELRVLGEDPAHLSAAARLRIGYLPQIPVLYPKLSLWGNLTFVASLYGVPLRGRRARLLGLLDLVELREHRTKRLADCSGGMQRRLTLAATLVHDPELLFLDEPTAGIDPILRERFWTRFRELRDGGRTLLVTTQYVGEAAMCDLVAVMAGGRLVVVDTPDGLRRRAVGGELVRVVPERGWLTDREAQALRAEPYVRRVDRTDDGARVVVADAADAARLAQVLERAGTALVALEPVQPSFDEVFVALVRAHEAERGGVDE